MVRTGGLSGSGAVIGTGGEETSLFGRCVPGSGEMRRGGHSEQRVPAESVVRRPARGLTDVTFQLLAAGRKLARVPAGDVRVLLSDCVHVAVPAPSPLAARLPMPGWCVPPM